MEVPAAFHGLKNRYENLRAKFSFGHFDPVEQGQIFQIRKKSKNQKTQENEQLLDFVRHHSEKKTELEFHLGK
ncbi:unnamed protein product [Didymodactylos carnosus]|uniref:Uncharacterized protein n=1 Tax=Didymodactylos carnosus TaxID=1234261 RepID=A0A8S2G4U1_9BILA|nr:unnamed protein product [Didymodactylos carnosus]CAF4449609.1 unnamed protein product [Didymodactylos carnosus]